MAFLPISETLKQESWRGPTRGVFLSLRVEKLLNQLLPQLLPPLADKVGMHSYREGKLTLSTSSPTTSQEVFLYTKALKRRLNEALGGKVVEEIKLKIRNIFEHLKI